MMKTKTLFWYLGMLLLSFAGVYFTQMQNFSEMVGGIIYGLELLIVSFLFFCMFLTKRDRPDAINAVRANEEKAIDDANKEIPVTVACECCIAGGFFLGGNLVLPVVIIAATAIKLFTWTFFIRKS